MPSRAARRGLLAVGFCLFLAKLATDLSVAASDGLHPNIANDLFNYFRPFLAFVSESTLSGEFPLWNPYNSIGNSLVGQVSLGLFHPTTWVVYLYNDTAKAMLLVQLLTVLIGSSGAYLYSRYLGLDMSARIVCAVLIGLTTFTESFSHSAGATSCWFGYVLLMIHRFYEQPGTKTAAALALTVSACFLGGFANYFVYTCIAAGAFYCILYLLSFRDDVTAGLFRRLGLLTLSAFLMLGIVAVQFLPTLELSALSIRDVNASAVSSFWDGFSGSLLFQNFIYPDRAYLFGLELLELESGIYYLGGALLLTLFSYNDTRTRKVAIALSVSCALLCLFILADKITALAFLQELPVIKSLRIHARAAVYVEFLLIFLACIGLSSIATEIKQASVKAVKVNAMRTAGILTAVLLVAVVAVSVVKSALLLWGLLLCALLLCCHLLLPARRFGYGMAWIIALVIVVDTGLHRRNRFLVPAFDNTHVYSMPQVPAIAPAHSDYYRHLVKPGSLEQTYSLANMGVDRRIFHISAYDNLTQRRWVNYIHAMIGNEKFSKVIADSTMNAFYGEFTPRLFRYVNEDRRVLGLASVRTYHVGQERFVYEEALPRAYVVSQFLQTGSEEESLASIQANLGRLHETVVLETGYSDFSLGVLGLEAEADAQADVEIQHYSANSVTVSVDTGQDAILVLTDAFYPGWNAYVDGKATTIHRANSLFRAVEVPAGKHTVTFDYRPISFYAGVVISMASLLVTLILIFVGNRRSVPASQRTSGRARR